jgi:hypothetical protein
MARLTAPRSSPFFFAALLVLGLGAGRAGAAEPKKVVVAVEDEAVVLNGTRLTLPFDRDELIKVLGKPSREADLSANKLLTWDDLGIVAYQQSNGKTIHGLSVALDKRSFSFWPKTLFDGTLTVDGAPLTATSDMETVNGAKKGKKFERNKVLPDTWAIQHERVLITLGDPDPALKGKDAKASYLQMSVPSK